VLGVEVNDEVVRVGFIVVKDNHVVNE